MPALDTLTAHLPALALGLAVLVLAVVLALVLRRWLARHLRPERRAARARRRARRARLRDLARSAPDARPWWLVVGPPAHGKTALLAAIPGAREHAPGPDDDPRQVLTPAAVLLECPSRPVPGDTPGPDDDELLADLRRLRPTQPVHGVLLVLRADALPTEPELDALRLRLARIARALAVQVPLVVVVTQLDRLAGLTDLTAELSSCDGPLGVALPPRIAPGALANALRDALLGDDGPVAWTRRRACALLARSRPEAPALARTYGAWPRLAELSERLAPLLARLGDAPHAIYFTAARPSPTDPTSDFPPTPLSPAQRPVLRDTQPRPQTSTSALRSTSLPTPISAPPSPTPVLTSLSAPPSPTPVLRDIFLPTPSLFVADLFAAELPRLALAAGRRPSHLRRRRALSALAALTLAGSSLLLAVHVTHAARAQRELARLTALHARAARPLDGPLPPLADLVGLADAAFAWPDLPAPALLPRGDLPRLARIAFHGTVCRGVLQPLAARVERSLRDLVARHPDSALPDLEWSRAHDRLRLLLLLSAPATDAEPGLQDTSQSTWATAPLADLWTAADGDAPDPRRLDVLRRHLADPTSTTGTDLCARSGFTRPLARDPALVAAARELLGRRPSERALVERMVDAIARDSGLRPVERSALTSAASLTGDARVHPAFTRDGWEAFRNALRHELRARDEHAWVLGGPGLDPPAERCERLRAVYVERYERAWREFFAALRLRAPSSLLESARHLADLGERAPLRPVFQALRRHTQDLRPLGCTGDAPLLARLAGTLAAAPSSAPDADDLADTFAPLVAFGAPPARPGEPAASSLDTYLERIVELRAALARALDDRAELPALQTAATQARAALDDLLHRGSLGPWSDPLRRLLTPPIAGLDLLVRTAAGDDLHAEWCAAIVRPLEQTVSTRYPFRADARLDARLDDLTRLLHPQSGELARFRDARLGGLVTVQGDLVRARDLGAGAALHLHPRALALLDAAHQLGLLLFPGDAPGLVADVTMSCDTAVHEVRLVVDGVAHTYTCSIDQAKQIAWPGAADPRGAALIALGPAGRRGELPALGEFGLFRLLERSRPEGRPGNFRVVFDLSRQGLGVLEVGVRPRPLRGGDLFHGRGDLEFLAPFRAAALVDPPHALFAELAAACP